MVPGPPQILDLPPLLAWNLYMVVHAIKKLITSKDL